jgi:hypothetical protein
MVICSWRMAPAPTQAARIGLRSFCSHLVRVGTGVEAVRALAGHSSIRVTNRYVHATGVDLRHAMGRGFRRAVGDQGGNQERGSLCKALTFQQDGRGGGARNRTSTKGGRTRVTVEIPRVSGARFPRERTGSDGKRRGVG